MGDGWHCPRQLNGIGASLRLDTPRPENSALSGLKQFRTPGVSSPRDAANPFQCCLRAIPPIPHKCNWPFYIYTPFNEGGTHNYSSALSELTTHTIGQFPVGLNGVARGNNCRGLLIALGEAEVSALWLCRLSQGAPERAIEISAFSCSCKGNAV